jgi:hypothetical protein
MLVWEEYHYPQAEKPNTYLRNDQAPSILQQFKIRKEQIKQKHILLLKQRKG